MALTESTAIFDRKLSSLEVRALYQFVQCESNHCKVICKKFDKDYMLEGLLQTIYYFEQSNEYIFIAKQKGYVIDAVLIPADEFELFKSLWESDSLTARGHIKK